MQLIRGTTLFFSGNKKLFLLLLVMIRKAWSDSGIKFNKLSDMSIKKGDYIMWGDKSMWIDYSAKELLSVQRCLGICKGLSLRLDLLVDPEAARAEKLPGATKKNWNAEKALALVETLQTKQLPYGLLCCNGDHYMRYIMYAKTYLSYWKLDCPLRRDLTGLTVDEIQAEDFYLEYGLKRKALYINTLKSFEYASRRKRIERLQRLKNNLPGRKPSRDAVIRSPSTPLSTTHSSSSSSSTSISLISSLPASSSIKRTLTGRLRHLNSNLPGRKPARDIIIQSPSTSPSTAPSPSPQSSPSICLSSSPSASP